MEKELNLEFLRYMAKGRKLYSPMRGDIEFKEFVDGDVECPIVTTYNNGRPAEAFRKDGKYWADGECMLFPSKECRNWNMWQELLQIGDFVVSNSGVVYYITGFSTTIQCIMGYGAKISISYGIIQEWASPKQIEDFKKELRINGYEIKNGDIKKIEKQHRYKVGDWVCFENYVGYIIDVNKGIYKFEDGYMEEINFVDANYHLWTINDAKDGDVLMAKAGAFIYSGELDREGRPCGICGILNWEEFYHDGQYNDGWTSGRTEPANKQQRGVLFKKMDEAGYEWDLNELKLIEKDSKEIQHLNIKELSIGNYITVNGMIGVICSITDDDNYVEFTTKYGTYQYHISKIRPLKLNENILTKCGFKKVFPINGTTAFVKDIQHGENDNKILRLFFVDDNEEGKLMTITWGKQLELFDSCSNFKNGYMHQLQNFCEAHDIPQDFDLNQLALSTTHH